jgi:hypothetical protein
VTKHPERALPPYAFEPADVQFFADSFQERALEIEEWTQKTGLESISTILGEVARELELHRTTETMRRFGLLMRKEMAMRLGAGDRRLLTATLDELWERVSILIGVHADVVQIGTVLARICELQDIARHTSHHVPPDPGT